MNKNYGIGYLTAQYGKPIISLYGTSTETPSFAPAAMSKLDDLSKKLIESRTKLNDIQKETDQLKQEIRLMEQNSKLSQMPKNTKFLFKTIELSANATCNVEICADFFGACKPKKITFQVSEAHQEVKSDIAMKISTNEKFVEIFNVTVMGSPQLCNYDAYKNSTGIGISKFYENEREIDWAIFGASEGQGLQISLKNPFEQDLEVSICIVGESASIDTIGTK